ncbi:hypothetical protein HZB03_02300 [Candidatus Woesearchaeota archaeon]|nr:hypothetical protein [Candidatus Woesearchaeota archaeon]
MGQYHDTVREELGEILDKLQEAYRNSHPNTVLLFATDKATHVIPDVARTTSALAPRQGTASLDYKVYTHNLPDGNSQVGQLHTEARMGQIDVGYVDRAEPERKLRFRVKVGFGSRVIDYELEGSDGECIDLTSKKYGNFLFGSSFFSIN